MDLRSVQLTESLQYGTEVAENICELRLNERFVSDRDAKEGASLRGVRNLSQLVYRFVTCRTVDLALGHVQREAKLRQLGA